MHAALYPYAQPKAGYRLDCLLRSSVCERFLVFIVSDSCQVRALREHKWLVLDASAFREGKGQTAA